MEFDFGVRINADVGQAEGERAGRAAFMEANLAIFPAVLFGLRLIVCDQTPDVLVDNNGSRRGRRRQIAQKHTSTLTGTTFEKSSPRQGENKIKSVKSALYPHA
jgi:hypothetical protein